MTKEQIMNTYAIEQGFESWYDFACNYKSKGYSTHSFLEHQNKVTDLIQEELKKKIVLENSFKKGSLIRPKENTIVYTEHLDKNSILNTEIL